MASEKVKDFLKRYKNDLDFKEALDSAPDIHAKRRIAREAGFEFTSDDIKEFTNLIKRELKEDELDKIVGGTNITVELIKDIKVVFDIAF